MNDKKKDIRKLTIGEFVVSEEFKKITAHTAICFDDTKELVAITGPAGGDVAFEIAKLFAAAPDMKRMLDEIHFILLEGTFEDKADMPKEWMEKYSQLLEYLEQAPSDFEDDPMLKGVLKGLEEALKNKTKAKDLL